MSCAAGTRPHLASSAEDEGRWLSKGVGDDAFPNGREGEHEGGFGEVTLELLFIPLLLLLADVLAIQLMLLLMLILFLLLLLLPLRKLFALEHQQL